MHYRAYTVGESANKGNETWEVEEVAFTGNGDTAEFDAGKTKITKIVFYDDKDTVTGSVDVNKSSKVSVQCPSAIS